MRSAYKTTKQPTIYHTTKLESTFMYTRLIAVYVLTNRGPQLCLFLHIQSPSYVYLFLHVKGHCCVSIFTCAWILLYVSFLHLENLSLFLLRMHVTPTTSIHLIFSFHIHSLHTHTHKWTYRLGGSGIKSLHTITRTCKTSMTSGVKPIPLFQLK